MTNLAAAAVYCELCGRAGTRNAGDVAPCPRCGVLACAPCRRTGEACWACLADDARVARRAGVAIAGPVAPIPLPSDPDTQPGGSRSLVLAASRPRPGSGVVVALGILCAALAVAVATGGGPSLAPSSERAGIGAGTPDAVPSAESQPRSGGERPESTPLLTAERALDLGRTSIPTWDDLRGAWHGQALATVRNAGEQALLVDAPSSRYAVVDDTGVLVVEGAFDAALPPVILPGQTSYLVARLTFPRSPGGGLQLVADPAASPLEAAPVPLQVAGVRVTFRGGEVIATGTVHNLGSEAVAGVAVGVVLLDQAGRPLTAVMAPAAPGTLDAGGRSSFRAVERQGPPLDPDLFRRLVAAAWASPVP